MSDTVFTDGQPASEQEVDPVLAAAIDSNKKKSVNELAKGKAHGDQFIEFLKEQNLAMKKDLDEALDRANKSKSAEAVLEELKARQSNRDVAENTEEHTSSDLNSETIKSLVKESIKEEGQRQASVSNMQMVDAAIKEKYGDKAKEFVAKKATELGLSVEELGGLAAKSPAGFFNLVSMGVEPRTPAPTKGTINPVATLSSQPKAGTKAHYDAMRKVDKKLFFTPTVQAQLFKDRERLGLDYYK